jgi:PiT family inorganic phosphate transporter
MSMTLVTVVALVGLAAAFDYTNGFHDSANSVATVVATGVLRPRLAVLWAAFWNFIAFLVFGTAVANTVAATVKTPEIGLALIFAGLVGALAWNLASWHLGLPTSSTHALIGGLVGAAFARGGLSAVSYSNLGKTALFIVASPLLGMAVGAGVMAVLRAILARRDVERTEQHFRRAQLVSSAAVSLGHGGNDAQKTMGVILALLIATQKVGPTSDVPLWVVLAAHSAIALGTLSGGWRVVHTLGARITKLQPAGGVSAESAAAATLFFVSAHGIPVSTTHTITGAIVGVGSIQRLSAVRWGVAGRVVWAWILTIPGAAIISAAAFLMLRPF